MFKFSKRQQYIPAKVYDDLEHAKTITISNWYNQLMGLEKKYVQIELNKNY